MENKSPSKTYLLSLVLFLFILTNMTVILKFIIIDKYIVLIKECLINFRLVKSIFRLFGIVAISKEVKILN
jgi:hypothetical protein